jgi:predicted ATPase/DNA-binding CsgD family transcriptional regulator
MATSSLPLALTTFIGREAELAVVATLVSERRLVTLTGTGGCGKTRMVTELGRRIGDRWPDGVWMVDLGTATDDAQVPRLVAAALEVLVDPESDPVQALTAQLRNRTLVICLDTCEHVPAGVAALIDVLLRTCPEVTVVATSRAPVAVEGETVWRVPSLRRGEAMRLFAERASLVVPGFDLAAVTGDVDRVCARVDDIPLGVELAAAWVRALTPAQIAADLSDRLASFTSTIRTAPARHQTLLASMTWSHDLLSPDEQSMFRRLAVFAGTFTLPAAADVSGFADALPLLGRLLDSSLVVTRQVRGEVRYRLLDTIRQYAGDRLRDSAEENDTRDQHLRHFLELAERAAVEIEVDQDIWREQLDSHHDNIDAALRWGLAPGPAGRAEQGRRLAAAMARQWFLRGQGADGHRFLQQALALDPGDSTPLQGRLHAANATLAMVSGRLRELVDGAARGQQIAERTGDDVTRARCLAATAYTDFLSDFERSVATAEQAWTLARAAGDPWARDLAGLVWAYAMQTRSRHDEALAVSDRTYRDSWPRHDRFAAGFARGVGIFPALYTGGVGAAVTIGQESIDLVTPLGDYFAVGTTICNAAQARAMSGDLAGAQRMLEPIVQSMDRTRDADVVGFMVAYGWVLLWAGDLPHAVDWFERGLRRLDSRERDWTATRCTPGLIAALRRLGRTDEATALAERAIAMAFAFDAPVEQSQIIDEQAWLVAPTDRRRARELLLESLTLRRDYRLRTLYADSLDALAALDAAEPDGGPGAVRLLAVSDAARATMPYPRPPVAAADHERLVAALRDCPEPAGPERSLDDTVAALTRGRGPRDRPSSGWRSLTPVERDVAMLVHEGLSNPDIAARLYISRSTVKAHLSHIFAKLGIANRTALAAVAGDHQDT